MDRRRRAGNSALRIVILIFGSYGDHIPSWEIACEAQRRGHAVTVFGNALYLERMKTPSIETVDVVTMEEAIESRRVLSEGTFSQKAAHFRYCCEVTLRRSYSALAARAPLTDTVLLAPHGPGGFAAHLWREQFGTPVMEYFVDPLPTLSSAAPWSERLMRWLMNHLAYKAVRGDLNRLRQELGLSKVGNVAHWAGQQVDVGCGFFPDFVSRARPYQPPRSRFIHSGFIPLREPEARLSESVEAFLQNGSPPVVISSPSWGTANRRFFEETQAGLRAARLRGIFAGFAEDIGDNPDCLAVPFVSFPLLLPRVQTFLHHGGAGTVAAALTAGIPQLVVPQLPMQRDYARRLQALGVGETLSPSAYRPDRIAARLKALITTPSVAARCREYAAILQRPGPSGSALCCDELEAMATR